MKWTALLKPEYILNPRQLARRLYRGALPSKAERVTAQTPWGWPIDVAVHDAIGKALVDLGVFDLAVSEVIWRLCDAGETALDLGANIGVMTALLARRVGASGRVFSFEAHPEIAQELRANVARWQGRAGIEVFEVALSDHEGSVPLEIPPEFARNRGLSRVAQAPTDASIAVPCAPLDSFLERVERIGLAKMDVEGHEEAVLHGSRQALERGAVRDWVFEHHPAYPSPVTELFERAGYTLFRIHKRFFRPELVPPSEPLTPSTWEAESYLATLDPARAHARLRAGGWQVLKGR